MNGWRGRGEDESNPALLIAAIGAALGLLVLGFMFFARSDDEAVSSSGFSDSGGASSVSFERRTQTGLAFVNRSADARSSSVKPESLPGAATAAGAAYPDAGAANSSADKTDKPDAGDLAALGVPTDNASLSRLANQHGLLSRLTDKVLGYPKVVRFILNNKIIVDGLFEREAGKRNCESGSALTAYMMNGSDPKGVSEDTPILQALMRHPESAAEAVNSEFGRRVMACPSVAQLQQNPSGLAQVVMANPALLSIVADPAAVSAVSANPQAAALFSAAESAAGVGGQAQ